MCMNYSFRDYWRDSHITFLNTVLNAKQGVRSIAWLAAVLTYLIEQIAVSMLINVQANQYGSIKCNTTETN